MAENERGREKMENTKGKERPEPSRRLHVLADYWFATYFLEAFGQFSAWRLTGRLPPRAGEQG